MTTANHPNPWHETTIAEMLDQTASRHPDLTAVVDDSRSLTFPELRSQRDQLAAALAELGVAEGTHVGIFLRRSCDAVVLFHAVWSLGAVAIPLNTSWESAEVADALRRAEIEVLFVGDEAAGRDIAHVVAELALPPGPVTGEPRFPVLRLVVPEKTDADADADGATVPPFSLASVLRHADERPPAPRSARQESLFLFTSGTQSHPKIVVLRQDGLMGTAHYAMSGLGVVAGDRFMSLGPYFHAGGVVQMVGSHLTGATHYVFDGTNTEQVVDIALAQGLNATMGFDPVLTRIIDLFESRGEDLPLTKIGCAPGTATYDRLAGMGLSPMMMYAMTEGGNMITLTDPRESESGRMSNGYPLPGVDVTIVEPETGAETAPGDAGEICFRGWNLFRGYYGDAGGAPVDAERLFHTGDFGWKDEEGRLYYRGRYSAMIKTGGENVSEAEVEHFLIMNFESIHSAAVIGQPDPRWGEAVVAFVQVDDPDGFDEAAMREACRGRLAGYKIPKRFIALAQPQWPVTQTGKILKTSLRATLGTARN